MGVCPLQWSYCCVKNWSPVNHCSIHCHLHSIVSHTLNYYRVYISSSEFSLFSGSHFADLFQAYSEDMSVKESVVGDVMRQNDRDILTVYLLCWLHHPYITTECSDKLEALLVDCGLRT